MQPPEIHDMSTPTTTLQGDCRAMTTHNDLKTTVLLDLARRIELLPDPQRPADRALGETPAAFGAFPDLDRAAVYLIDPGTGAPVLRAAFSRREGIVGEDPFGLGEGLLGRALAAKGPFCLPPLADAPVASPDCPDNPEAGTLLGASLPGARAPLGVLVAERLFGDAGSPAEELEFLALAALLIARRLEINQAARAERRALRREILSLREKVSESFHYVVSVGQSRALEQLGAAIETAALGDAPVVIRGGPGTGKGLVARVVHELSARARRPFTLLDAAGEDAAIELFGALSETGQSERGLLDHADGGVLCVHDADALADGAAQRLAAFAATGAYARSGDDRTRRADVRIMAATTTLDENRDGALVRALRAGRFERIRVPSLAERPEDLPALIDYALSNQARRLGRKPRLTQKALQALQDYDWPGNIRELEEAVAKACVTGGEERIDITDIPPHILQTPAAPAEHLPEDAAGLRAMERLQILDALERHGWIQSRAARELGLSLRQIGYRIKKYGLKKGEPPAA